MALPDIRALVAERQRFDDWLIALESRRAGTPARVFDRVHADYVARRDAVIEGLHAHVGSLETLEQDLNNRLQQVESQLAEREDAHAEGILRTAVGEFDNERWEVTRQEVEASIAQLEQNRAALNAEGDDVRSLLESARPKKVNPDPEPEPLVVPVVEDVQSELVSSNVAAAIAHADPAAVEHTVDLDVAGEVAPAHEQQAQVQQAQVQQAQVQQVQVEPTQAQPIQADDVNTTDPYLRAVGRNEEAAADIESAFAVSDDTFASLTDANDAVLNNAFPASQITGANQTLERDQDREADAAIDALGAHGRSLPDALDDIDVFGESVATPRSHSAEYIAPRSNNDPYAPRAQASESLPHSMPNSAPPKRDAFDDLAFLRSVTESGTASSSASTRSSGTTDQAKTLRCTECGTMNFPTEWYCERCGGELATF